LLGATQQEIISTTLTEGQWCGEVANCDNQGRWFIVEARTTLLRDESGQAVGMCGVARDITERKSTEQALQTSLAEKDVLLREVHHRVKNNLAAICGLLDLQCLTLDEPDAKKILTELSGRVRSMSLVHEQLYRSESLANVNCQEYLQTLVTGLCSLYPSNRITCSVSAEGVSIPLDQAVPCGLIVTELVTNALKYAFPADWSLSAAGPCCINVSLSRDQSIYTLSVADNGVGLPEGFVWTAAKTLGLVLVRMLGQHQLGGDWAISRTGGTCFTLTFTPGIRRNNHD
jgi:two-component sensor histidine kinase